MITCIHVLNVQITQDNVECACSLVNVQCWEKFYHHSSVCVWKVFLTRVAGNLSIAQWVSENEILDFIYLFLLGELAYVWYSMLNNVMLSSLVPRPRPAFRRKAGRGLGTRLMLSLSLWGYHSSSYIFDCSAISSSWSSFCWSSGEFPVWS